METGNTKVAVVGLGLMGCSIVTCLLMAKHPVIALAPIESDLDHVLSRVRTHLIRSKEEGFIAQDYDHYLANLKITQDYTELSDCKLVIECVIEDLEIKKEVYQKIEDRISSTCLLTTNTSAIPISDLQKLTRHPNRFLGLHWAEPSHTTRFLEIICGGLTDVSFGEHLYKLAHKWGKEPTLVRRDIRGFITNRLMYALYREAFHLVENGYASVEDVDRACRNNAGYWMTLMGPFRWMDVTGVPAYLTVMKDLWPTLSNETEAPKLIRDIVEAGGRGVSNASGFYKYTKEEAVLWEKTFEKFSYEIRELGARYPHDVVSKQL